MRALDIGSRLVDARWLEAHLEEVVVLDASIRRVPAADGSGGFENGREVYEAGHIPGALFADMFLDFSDPGAEFAFTKPTGDQMRRACAAVGVGAHTRVVVYDQLTGAYAARLWWLFEAFGVADARVLDGGFAAWTEGGRPVERGPAAASVPPRFEVEPVEKEGYFVGLEQMKLLARADDPRTVVVCGVREPEYVGDEAAPRSGHIPGSVNVPYPSLLAADGALDRAKVDSAIATYRIHDADRVVLYCGGAINAAGLALALHEAGIERTTLYDGSLNEWRADPALPLVTGKDPR